ncbi:MAG: DNA-directed RNA polymerase subunit RPC12/RpoP [Cyclobacteriaceae bacterium]|jgi:DNA-directed RNA polymerase subunit RPC12/RpoP
MENKEAYVAFLETWSQVMWYAFIGSIALSVILFLRYQIRYIAAKGHKQKFELASQSEINAYLYVNYALASGIFFIANTTKTDIVELSIVWFSIRIFISLCLGTLHGYIAFLIFRYYYPGPLEKKLNRLRYAPRINPATGNKMKLLAEDEEDAYLDEGMQAEEDAFSVDYDVWIDEATGDTHIEKYKGHLNALECDRCGFQTLKLEKEEVLKKPTDTEDGEIEKEYKCSYCGRIKRKTMKLTNKFEKSGILDALHATDSGHAYPHDRHIEMIKIEIHDSLGDTKIYEFQNREQAKKFLDESDFSKLRQESI